MEKMRLHRLVDVLDCLVRVAGTASIINLWKVLFDLVCMLCATRLPEADFSSGS
jgi:hypothetical protein